LAFARKVKDSDYNCKEAFCRLLDMLNALLGSDKPLVFCITCGECVGKYRPNYGKAHLKKYPEHKGFLVKKLRKGFER